MSEPTDAEILAVLRAARRIYADHGGHAGSFVSLTGKVCANGAICEAIYANPNPWDTEGIVPAFFRDPLAKAVASHLPQQPNTEAVWGVAAWHDWAVKTLGPEAVLLAFDAAIATLAARLGKSDAALSTPFADLRDLFVSFDEVMRQ